MKTGTITINGVSYTFGQNGEKVTASTANQNTTTSTTTTSTSSGGSGVQEAVALDPKMMTLTLHMNTYTELGPLAILFIKVVTMTL